MIEPLLSILVWPFIIIVCAIALAINKYIK